VYAVRPSVVGRLVTRFFRHDIKGSTQGGESGIAYAKLSEFQYARICELTSAGSLTNVLAMKAKSVTASVSLKLLISIGIIL
jgi:hypothetical protein